MKARKLAKRINGHRMGAKPAAVKPRPTLAPTPERLAKSDGEYYQVQEGSDRGSYVMKDAPAQRLLKRGVIGPAQFLAGQRYAEDWYAAGQAERYATLNLDRVDGGASKITDARLRAQQAHREARMALGHHCTIVVEEVFCRGRAVYVAGQKAGWAKGMPSHYAGEAVLLVGLDRLMRHYGIT